MTLLHALDLLGTAAFAASGAWAGIRHRMDLFGVLVLAMVTAVGGGPLRDLLLGDVPVFCLRDETYFFLSLAVAAAVFCFHARLNFLQHPLVWFDALGLGTFVVIGTRKALHFGLGPVGAVMMGIMTATAGGLVRDVLSGQVPLILRREIYASACLAGALLLVLLHRTPLPEALVACLSGGLVIVLRILAIRRHWQLPRADDE